MNTHRVRPLSISVSEGLPYRTWKILANHWHVYVPHGEVGCLARIVSRDGTETVVKLLERVSSCTFLSLNVNG